MLALLATANGPYLDPDHALPELAAGEVRLRVHCAGICATDLAILRGYARFRGVLGHEIVGEVEAVGDVRHRHWIGRRVVPSINVGCGRCACCAQGMREHCATRRVLGIRGRDGGFATQVDVPIENLHPLDDSLADEVAVFAEPLAAAWRITEQVELAGRRAVVVGAGRLGLLIAQVLRLAGAEVLVVVRSADRAALAESLGLVTGPADALPPASRDVVVEATGTAAGVATALDLVAPRGVLVLKSTLDRPLSLASERLVVDELTVLGSRCGPIDVALGLLRDGRVTTAPLLAATYPLADGLAALEHAARPGVLKVLLHP